MLVWLFKANLILWTINAIILVFAVGFGRSLEGLLSSRFLSVLTLLETGAALIVAGAIAFSGSASTGKVKEIIRKTEETWSIEDLRKSEKRANKYIVFAATVFLEALVISFLGL